MPGARFPRGDRLNVPFRSLERIIPIVVTRLSANPSGGRRSVSRDQPAMGTGSQTGRYLVVLGLFVGALLGATLAVNVVVDPLWYYRGNRITGMNFGYDERIGKTNQFLKDPRGYDCLLFGGSRATLLDVGKIEGHRCYNYAVSAAVVGEFIDFAVYAKSRGIAPSLVIADVNEFTFRRDRQATRTPDFILRGEDPPSMLLSYLSLSALRFSLATLRKWSSHDRYYRSDFVGDVIPWHGRYVPRPLRPAATPAPAASLYRADIVPHYARLRAVFPQARYVGYVPPVSAWRIAQLELDGVLDQYLDLVLETARHFDTFYDFGVPSAVTENPKLTYDGGHYFPAINDRVARAITTGAPDFGLVVDWRAPEAYKREFRARVANFLRFAVADSR